MDFATLGEVYRPDQEIPAATVRRFLKKKVAKRMIEKKIKELLKDKAIDKETPSGTMTPIIVGEVADRKEILNYLKEVKNDI